MVVCVYQTPLTHPLPTPITPASLFQTTPSAGAGHQDTLGAFLRKSAGTKQASSQIKSDIRRLTELSRCFQFDWTSSSQVHVVAAGMHGDLHCCCVCVFVFVRLKQECFNLRLKQEWRMLTCGFWPRDEKNPNHKATASGSVFKFQGSTAESWQETVCGYKLLWSPLKHAQMEMASTQRCTFLLKAREPKSEKILLFGQIHSTFLRKQTNTPIGANTQQICRSLLTAAFLKVSFPPDVILGRASSY